MVCMCFQLNSGTFGKPLDKLFPFGTTKSHRNRQQKQVTSFEAQALQKEAGLCTLQAKT